MANGGLCHFSFAGEQESFTPIGEKFQATEGKWIGAKVGIFCCTVGTAPANSYADFDYFHFGTKK